MAYSTKIKEPSQDPIVLFEVDLPLENTLWINEGAGLWKKNLTPGTVTVTGSNDEEGYYGTQNETIYYIQSMRVNNQIFSKMSSWANMEAQNKSFYYDQSATTIHAHFDQFNPPYVYENIILGATKGFCNRVDPANDGLYNNIVYDPRIISVPDVERKKDFLFFGLLQYTGGTVVLQNIDGELDSLRDANLMSRASRFLAGFAGDAYSDFKLFDGFFVDDYSFNFDEFRLEIVDIRKRLSRTLPVAQFDATTYPDIDPKNVGENIPMPIGQVYDAPVICTNDEEGVAPPAPPAPPAIYTFKLAYIDLDNLTQYGVKAGQTIVVRVNGADSLDTVVLDAAAGTFTLKLLVLDAEDAWVSGDYDATKHKGKVTVDFIGYVDNGNATIENNLDVLKLVVSEFLGIAYIGDNYNTTEWAAEAAGVFDIGIFINKDLEVSELIEMCCTTEDGVYLIQDDGKITFKTSNTNPVLDPEDLTTANWTEVLATAALSDLYYDGKRFTKVSNDGAVTGTVFQLITDLWATLTPSFSIIIRKGNSAGNTTEFKIVDNTAVNTMFYMEIDWDNYPNAPGTPTAGILFDYDWKDSETVELRCIGEALGALGNDVTILCAGSNNATANEYTYWTAVQAHDISLTIYDDEIHEDVLPEIDPRTQEYLSSVIIGYSKQVKENRFLKQLNNTYEQEVLNNYGRYKQRTIETLLTNSTDATAKAEAIMLSSKTIPIIVGIQTGLQTSELEIFDTINAEIDRPDKALFGMAKYEVLGVSKRLMDGTVDLTLKYVEAA